MDQNPTVKSHNNKLQGDDGDDECREHLALTKVCIPRPKISK